MDIARLYETCAPLAFRRARRFLDHEAAWDVVHDVFERIARNPEPVRAAARPMAYIYRATTNACLNDWKARELRRDPTTQETVASLFAVDAPIDDTLAAQELLAGLWRSLDDVERRIAVLHYLDGLAQEEIAEVLGVWRRTVGRRLDRIREKAKLVSGENP